MAIDKNDFLKKMVREVVVDYLKPKAPMFKEDGNDEESEAPSIENGGDMKIQTAKDKEQQSFEEDPVNYILAKYPSLTSTLQMLMTKDFKDYITGIYIIAPKPTTFKIVLHNGNEFLLRFMGKAYQATVAGKRYFLLTLGEKERATIAIARLLETGSPITVKGPDSEETSKAGEPEEWKEETPSETEEEETTES